MSEQIAHSTVPTGSTADLEGREAIPLADRPGGAVAGVPRLWAAVADRLGVGSDRPDRHPGDGPAIDPVAGLDRANPPDDVIEALEQDRYYRWITYLFLPIQYAGFVGAMYFIARRGTSSSTSSAWRSRSGASAGSASTPRTSSATARGQRALALEGRPRAELLRALLHRAQPRPPRPGRDPGGPGAARVGETSTGSGRAPSAARCGPRGGSRSAARPQQQHPFRLGNDVLNAWLMSAVLWGALIAWLGAGSCRPGGPGGASASRC